jgi:hypothetical protein
LIQIGCASKDTICQTEKYCAFLGQSKSGGYGYWILEGFQPRKVSDEFVERVLNSETTIENTKGYCCRIVGHMFYFLNLYTVDRTFVYDPDEKLWHEWSTGASGGTFGNRFVVDYASDGNNGYFYGQVSNNGNVCYFDASAGIDSPSFHLGPYPQLTSIDVLIRTNRIDMDTTYRKRLHSLRLFMDSDIGTVIILSMFDADDDTQVGNTSYFMASRSNTDTIPTIYRLGQFRRRSFEFNIHSTDPSIRFEAMELCYTEGTS